MDRPKFRISSNHHHKRWRNQNHSQVRLLPNEMPKIQPLFEFYEPFDRPSDRFMDPWPWQWIRLRQWRNISIQGRQDKLMENQVTQWHQVWMHHKNHHSQHYQKYKLLRILYRRHHLKQGSEDRQISTGQAIRSSESLTLSWKYN